MALIGHLISFPIFTYKSSNFSSHHWIFGVMRFPVPPDAFFPPKGEETVRDHQRWHVFHRSLVETFFFLWT